MRVLTRSFEMVKVRPHANKLIGPHITKIDRPAPAEA